MYDTILVPLDGSELAEAILPHVAQLAPLFNATVVLLGVIELPHMLSPRATTGYDDLPTLSPQELQARAAETQAYLEDQAAALAAAGITARARVEYGPVVATIIHAAQNEDAGLIAMASHGRGGLTDVYYGSVAAGILQRIDRPLLIVRAKPQR
jgi:nucleotide-binding universal stress UspA family protein